MRRCVHAVAFAASVAMCGVGAASAQMAGAEDYILFSGADLWRNGGFLHAGLIWSPGGIDREGFTMKALIGGGVYRYRSGATEFTGLHSVATTMAGWRFKEGSFEATAFVGLEHEYHSVRSQDGLQWRWGESFGPRLAADLWWEPTALSMASASIGYSPAAASYFLRGALGWRFFDLLYLGPEAQALGDERYRQFRFGAHATALRTGPFEWTAGFGYVHDSDHRAGAYGRIGGLTRY